MSLTDLKDTRLVTSAEVVAGAVAGVAVVVVAFAGAAVVGAAVAGAAVAGAAVVDVLVAVATGLSVEKHFGQTIEQGKRYMW